MSAPSPAEITSILVAARQGDSQAAQELIPIVYDELRNLAGKLMQREQPGATLDPTSLVHEAFLKLLGGVVVDWQNRRHFFSTAALAMRRILIDRARHHATPGGLAQQNRFVLESDEAVAPIQQANALVALDRALADLEILDPRKSEVVMLRYFSGLGVEETAAAMELSPRTVKREWSFARAWLYTRMDEITAGDTSNS